MSTGSLTGQLTGLILLTRTYVRKDGQTDKSSAGATSKSLVPSCPYSSYWADRPAFLLQAVKKSRARSCSSCCCCCCCCCCWCWHGSTCGKRHQRAEQSRAEKERERNVEGSLSCLLVSWPRDLCWKKRTALDKKVCVRVFQIIIIIIQASRSLVF